MPTKYGAIIAFQIIPPGDLTDEQLSILKRVSRERVEEHLMTLLSEGKMTAAAVQARYGALMNQVGQA